MGRGIAQVALQAGCTVRLLDVTSDVVQSGLARIGKDLGRLVAKGKLTDEASAEIQKRLTGTTNANDLASCAFIIEAATENLELKLDIFRQLDSSAGRNAILASNTSSISLTKLAGVTGRPDRVVGMHFMNPVPVMKLVEIVKFVERLDGQLNDSEEINKR
jgi:3-hydroxybutyryl-CoA dehydrogenase